jgi:ATP-dependent Lhr-like helicase
MRSILLEDEMDPRWSQRARRVVTTMRADHAFLRDGEELVEDGTNDITWHNFAGGAANLLLARVLERELGGHVGESEHVA